MQSLSLDERPQLIYEWSWILNPSQNWCFPTTWRHCQCFLAVCDSVSSNFWWSKWFVAVIHGLEALIHCLNILGIYFCIMYVLRYSKFFYLEIYPTPQGCISIQYPRTFAQSISKAVYFPGLSSQKIKIYPTII